MNKITLFMHYKISRTILVIIILILFLANHVAEATAQTLVGEPEYFYYYFDQKIPLSISPEKIGIFFEPNLAQATKEQIVQNDPALDSLIGERLPSDLQLVRLKPNPNKEAVLMTLDRLDLNAEIKYTSPVFKYEETEQLLTDQIIVQFQPEATRAQIDTMNREYGLEIARDEGSNRYILRVIDPKVTSPLALANMYHIDSRVVYATPDFQSLSIRPQVTTPNDTYWSNQWTLNNTGQTPPGGTSDADIDAPEAWDIKTGSSSIVIAIIDSGVNGTNLGQINHTPHEDLNIWTNSDEGVGDSNGDGRPGIANVDDDGDGKIDEDSQGRQPGDPGYTNDLVNDDDENGYIDDFHGWDWVGNNDNDPNDVLGHGTACAGIAGAKTNNNQGVSGVVWGADIIPLRIFDGYSYPVSVSEIADAIRYAVKNGANVLSNSWGGGSPNTDITTAIQSAKDGRDGKGSVVVFSSEGV